MRIKFLWNIYALLPKVKPNQIYNFLEEFSSSVPLKDPPYNFIMCISTVFCPFLGMLSADEDLVSSAVSMPVFIM